MLTRINYVPKVAGLVGLVKWTNHLFFYFLISCSVLHISLPQLVAQTVFIDKADQQGIDHYYGQGVAGGGVSFVDFDQDGWDDLTMASQEGNTVAFYRNINGVFTLITPLVSNLDEVKQVLWIDIDNDGDKDLFLTSINAVNRLYENLGNLQLKDITEEAGLSMESTDSYGACMADIDRDGWLDIYVTERSLSFSSNRNYLYRNLGNNTFEEVAEEWGLDDPGKAPFFPAFFDMNNDNWPDVYIAQDKSQGNTLLLHRGTENSFADISVAASANLIMNAMGIAIGDYNCEGWQDLYISNTPHGNALLANDQMGGFLEQAEATGTTFNGTAWGTHFLDADNDGFEDLYVSGMAVGTDVVSSAFYYNDQQGSFYVDEAGFVGDTVSSFGNAIGDYNNDGNLDILVVNTNVFPAQLWSNEGSNGQGWLKIKLEGVISNREGIGARVDLYSEEHYQIRSQHGGMGYLGQNSALLHFGIGERLLIDSLTVTWPTGHVDRFYEVVPNQLIDIQEGTSTDGEIMVDNALISNAENREVERNWKVYPNPAQNNIFVQYKGEMDGQLMIYTLAGQQLQSWRLTTGQAEYPLAGLLAGTYILQLREGERTWNRKLVVLP